MVDEINIKFGRAVSRLRQKNGLTQEQLAELIRTSYKYVQRIEGKTPPDIRLSTIKRIATSLNTTPAKLLRM